MGTEAVCSVIRVDGKWVQASSAVRRDFVVSLNTSGGDDYAPDVYYEDTPLPEED